MATVFMSYSHKDEVLRDQLEAHLALLKNQRLVETWHDRRILAGEQFDDAIFENLEIADIILLLVSSDFISSDYCYSREMNRAMERHRAREAFVVPVILRPCDWHSAPFGGLMAVPKDGKAITTWTDRDEAFTDVAKQLRRHVEAWAKRSVEAPKRAPTEKSLKRKDLRPMPSMPTLPPELAAAMNQSLFASLLRSSSLPVKQEYSEKEQADYLQEAFEFICRHFENSAKAVGDEKAGVSGRFQRINSRAMSVVLYQSGQTLAECSIRLQVSTGGNEEIAFEMEAFVRSNSYNELLRVEVGDEGMVVRPTALAMLSAPLGMLSQQGAARYLWGVFKREAKL